MKKNVLVFNLTPRFWMLHYSSQFCNALAENHNVSVVLADYYTWDLYNDNINLIKVKTDPNLGSFICDSLNILQHIQLFKKIKRLKPDIIHFIDNHPWYILYGKLLKKLWYTIYVTQHDPILHSWDCKWIQWKIAVLTNRVLREVSDKLIVHGENLRNDLINEYKVKSEKIIVVPHGNYNFFTRWSDGKIKPIENVFLFFGRIVEYKGIDILLQSLEFVRKEIPAFKLIIAWSWDTNSYKSLLDKYSQNIILYNQNIPDEEIYRYFEMAEFVVLPYKDATGSGVIPLAFAFSKAVIVSNVWELWSVTKEANGGHVIDDLTPKNLAIEIIKCMKDKKNTIQLWRNGREYTETKLWWKAIVNDIYFVE